MTDPTIIVVPDGLESDGNGNALESPSFVFLAVLDAVVKEFSHFQIIVAPANNFGAKVSEHEIGVQYLKNSGCSKVFAPQVITNTYIDTMGNALYLKEWLLERGDWPLGPVILVSAFRHSARARYCFNRAGFSIIESRKVPYIIPNNAFIVSRLFYYRFPLLHCCYEFIARLKDILSTRGK